MANRAESETKINPLKLIKKLFHFKKKNKTNKTNNWYKTGIIIYN